ncbi:hypothetical protein [Salidesulfovibrio brasiliensis]|uniref:hypothetical protein n=1 Tax=Salidesulfovibrio brasiliensis TaxID=221711 RepID=UPI0006D1FE15|nr:hypothetical protein [Salidesulfovibrio brasiliensis]
MQAIQLDPPCSGWGTINKDPKVRERWTPERLGPLTALQRDLLAKAADLLAPGGRLVYSTCTTHEGENEEQALWALENLPLEQTPLARPQGFVFDDPGLGIEDVLRVADDSEGQGFFVAAFVKTGDAEVATAPKRDRSNSMRLDKLPGAESIAFDALPPGRAQEHNGRVYWTPKPCVELMNTGLKAQGTPIGRLAGRGPKTKFRPEAVAWGLLPVGPLPSAYVAETEELTRLLSGQGLPSEGRKHPSGLYWRGLRLGWLTPKGNRLLWQER